MMFQNAGGYYTPPNGGIVETSCVENSNGLQTEVNFGDVERDQNEIPLVSTDEVDIGEEIHEPIGADLTECDMAT